MTAGTPSCVALQTSSSAPNLEYAYGVWSWSAFQGVDSSIESEVVSLPSAAIELMYAIFLVVLNG